jgi:hypothetical protein
VPSRIAFSTLAFPDATLAAAVSAGRRWGYSGGYPHWISVAWEKRWHPEIEDPEVALPRHRADPGNPGRAAGLGLRGRHVAGTAPGPGGPPRRVQRTEGFTLAARSLKSILNELGISWR